MLRLYLEGPKRLRTVTEGKKQLAHSNQLPIYLRKAPLALVSALAFHYALQVVPG